MQKRYTVQSILWMTMRLTLTPLLLIVLLAGLAYARPSEGQNVLVKRVTMRAEAVEIRQVLDQLARQTNVKFVYSANAIRATNPVTVQAVNQPLGDVLNQLLLPLRINYEVINDRIVLRRQLPGKTPAPPPASTERNVPAADRTITGHITDESGADLPGVSVVLKGTQRGTTTNTKGNFSLNVPEGRQTLIISFIGYVTREVDIQNQTQLKLVLTASDNSLDEVVVVGYGTQSKREVISSIGTVGADRIDKINTASFEQALQGNVAGLRINVGSGDPDADTRIQIRGTKSVTAGTEPFILIDGVPINNGAVEALSTINPNDIENISVLKDAAATSIYGSRGANGVILITTKAGKSGKGQFSYRYEQGITKPINQPQLANASEWRSLLATARKNAGYADPSTATFLPIRLPLFDQRNGSLTRYADLNLFNTTDTDWASKLIPNGSVQSHTFSISKAAPLGSYYISGNYFDQTPNWLNTRFRRYTGRVNLSFSPSKVLKIDIRNSFTYTHNERRSNRGSNNNINDPLQNRGGWGGYMALYSSALPVFPERWPDTNEPFDPIGGNNLIYSASRDNARDDLHTNRNLASVSFVLTPYKGLTLQSDLGVDYTTSRTDMWISRRLRAANIRPADIGSTRLDTLGYIYDGADRFDELTSKRLNLNANVTARYEFELQKRHKFSALLGYELTDIRNKQSELITQNNSSRIEDIPATANTPT
jgi:TonB-dependent starch-binding outer membrane protein SusC